MDNYCKSFDAETMLRNGGVSTQNMKFPVVTFTPKKTVTCEHSFPVLPYTTRGDSRGLKEVPWELVQGHDALTLTHTMVVDPTPTSLGEVKRPDTLARPYMHYINPRFSDIDIESKLKYDTESDRFAPHPPAVEYAARDFVGGGTPVAPDVNLAGVSTRFDTVVACKP